MDIWNHSNCYTKSYRSVKLLILKVYELYLNLTKIELARREEKWKEQVKTVHQRFSTTLFDVSCTDPNRRKRLEIFYGVTMTRVEYDYVEDQRGLRIMYCDNYVDRQWQKMASNGRKWRKMGWFI